MAITEREGRFLGWTNYITVADGETEIVSIPPLDSAHRISVTAIPGSNTALVQYTTSSDADVIADTATWQNWIYGSVSATTNGVVIAPITGLKLGATGGECNFEIVY